MVAPFHEKAKLRSKSSPMAATQPPRPTPGLKPTKSSGMRGIWTRLRLARTSPAPKCGAEARRPRPSRDHRAGPTAVLTRVDPEADSQRGRTSPPPLLS